MQTKAMRTGMIALAAWAAAPGLGCGAGSGASGGATAAAPPGGTAASPAAAPAFTAAPGDIAITNATVVPMSRDGELPHHTVIVRGDRIVAVAPSGRITVPAGATVIDGTGKWVLPGLTDMHVHVFGNDQLALLPAAGVTLVRNMFGSEMTLAHRARIAKGELFGPTIVTAGPLIDGDPPIWPGSTVLVNPADADKVVAEQKAAGYDFLKPYSRLSKPAYEALAAAGKRQGMLLEGHVPESVGLAGVLAAGQRTIEHLDGYLLGMVPEGVELGEPRPSRMRAILEHQDRARLPGLIQQTLAAGTWNCPTLIVYERFGALDDLPALRKRVAWLDKLPPGFVASWDPKQDFRLQSFTAADFATVRASNAERAKVLAALAAADAPLLVGTDTGNPFVVPGAAVHDEIELMIGAGLSRPRVLRAATADAARFLGMPHEFGVVEPGARADLLLVTTDPLAAPLPLVPDGLVLRGAWLSRADIEAKLADITKRTQAPPPKDRWDGVPALAADGVPVHRAHYDMASAGNPIGEERVAVSLVGGKRAIVGQQVAEYAGRFDTGYTIAADHLVLTQKSSFGEAQLTAKLAGGKLVATGTASAKLVSQSEALPPGGFLSDTSGIGGALVLAEHLAGVAPGGKRQLVALVLSTYPKPGISTVHYDVERRPDAGGNRVFGVTIRQDRPAVTGELVLDAAGTVVSQKLGPPELTFTRRAP